MHGAETLTTEQIDTGVEIELGLGRKGSALKPSYKIIYSKVSWLREIACISIKGLTGRAGGIRTHDLLHPKHVRDLHAFHVFGCFL